MEKFRVPEKQPALETAAKERRCLEKSGYFLCLGCKEPCVELENPGEHNQCCKKCKSVVQWIPPSPSRTGRWDRAVKTDGDSENRISMDKAKASLSDACFKGFHTCTDCGHITEVADGKCRRCGSVNVIWNKPVLGAEIVEGAQAKAQPEEKKEAA